MIYIETLNNLTKRETNKKSTSYYSLLISPYYHKPQYNDKYEISFYNNDSSRTHCSHNCHRSGEDDCDKEKKSVAPSQ